MGTEKAMATHSSTLAWKIPWTEEPGRLQSMGSQRVGHEWATSLSLFTFMHWRRKWQPTPVFLPGESQGRGAWWAAVSGVAQSRTWLKRLSSSSSRIWGNEEDEDEQCCLWNFPIKNIRFVILKYSGLAVMWRFFAVYTPSVLSALCPVMLIVVLLISLPICSTLGRFAAIKWGSDPLMSLWLTRLI